MNKTLIAAAVAAAANAEFTMSQAYISRQLSADAYCDNQLTHTFEGTAAGFVATKVLYDKPTDTNGYIGYLPSDNSIYVAFQGSQSIKNWVTNLDATQAPYNAWPECNCNVHKGFQDAYESVYADVLSEV